MSKYFRSKLSHNKMIIFFRIEECIVLWMNNKVEERFSTSNNCEMFFGKPPYIDSTTYLRCPISKHILLFWLLPQFRFKFYEFYVENLTEKLTWRQSWNALEIRYATDKKSSIMRLSFEHNFFEALNFEVLQALSLFTKMSLFYHFNEKELMQIDIQFADNLHLTI